MGQPERYVFVCVNQRPAGHPKGSCLDRGADNVFNALREEQGRRLMKEVKVVATGCMEGCLAGPCLLVVPDNVWYGGVTEADVPTLFDEHFVGNKPVEMLRLEPDDFCA
jgi:(2Fe-2S) ferredoxin